MIQYPRTLGEHSLLDVQKINTTARCILMKSVMDVISLEATPIPYLFLQSVIPTCWIHELVM